MVNIGRITAQLTLHEDRRSKPYLDSVGKLTIGIGRNLDDVGLSQDEIDYLFANDLRKHWAALITALPWIEALSEVRQRVLLDMAFNLGVQGLHGFPKMIAALKRGDYETAADEMVDSLWFTQVKSRGVRLEHMMRTGVDFTS